MALADPTRRKIMEILAQNGQLPASDIYHHFEMSAPAVSQHLKVLREAQLVKMEKDAQRRLYTINPDTVQEIESWARKTVRLWSERFDRLDALLKEEMEEK